MRDLLQGRLSFIRVDVKLILKQYSLTKRTRTTASWLLYRSPAGGKVLALAKLCDDEHLDKEQFKALIEAYLFNGQDPLRDDVLKCLGNRPSILQASEIGERIITKMKQYVEVFVTGMVA